jgi:hypothetical protein
MRRFGSNSFSVLAMVSTLLSSQSALAQQRCPQTATDGDFALHEPGTRQPLAPFTTLLTADAVLTSESEAYEPDLWETDAPIELNKPVRLALKKATRFGNRFFEGQVHRCVFWGLDAFEPPIDDEGRGFPTICLEDRDHDGGFETLRLYAYKAQPGKGTIETNISPVRLNAYSGPVAAKPFMTFYRRVRVASVDGERATFRVEFGWLSASPFAPTEPTFGEPQSLSIPLHEGILTVGGIELNVIRAGDQWSATPTGHSSPWVRLECGGSKVAFRNE